VSVKTVEEYFNKNNIDIEVKFFKDTSTVEKAAKSLGVTPGEIAKSLLFSVKDEHIMILLAGDKKLDNRKFKDTFHCKAKMPSPEEVIEVTGHPVGGVCPFGLKTPMNIYLDESLKAYETVYPAAGDVNAAVALDVEELADLTKGQWIDVAKDV